MLRMPTTADKKSTRREPHRQLLGLALPRPLPVPISTPVHRSDPKAKHLGLEKKQETVPREEWLDA